MKKTYVCSNGVKVVFTGEPDYGHIEFSAKSVFKSIEERKEKGNAS